jgi:hypothetical protein
LLASFIGALSAHNIAGEGVSDRAADTGRPDQNRRPKTSVPAPDEIAQQHVEHVIAMPKLAQECGLHLLHFGCRVEQ